MSAGRAIGAGLIVAGAVVAVVVGKRANDGEMFFAIPVVSALVFFGVWMVAVFREKGTR